MFGRDCNLGCTEAGMKQKTDPGVQGARYKSYKSASEAQEAFKNGYEAPSHGNQLSGKGMDINQLISSGLVIANSICVDAACSGNPGDLEYRGVETVSGKQLFHVGPLTYGTNNIGEFLAIVHAAAAFKNSGRKDVTIYTDSITAIAWVRDKRSKVNCPHSGKPRTFDLVDRALRWLDLNHIPNPVKHWNTPDWGEIPADFGRK